MISAILIIENSLLFFNLLISEMGSDFRFILKLGTTEEGTNACLYVSHRYVGVCYSKGSEHHKENCSNRRLRCWGGRDTGMQFP